MRRLRDGRRAPGHRRRRSPSRRPRAREPGKLRIGLSITSPIEAELDPICERGVRDAAELLAALGHEVEEFDAPWSGDDLLRAFTAVFGTPIAAAAFYGGLVTGREPSARAARAALVDLLGGTARALGGRLLPRAHAARRLLAPDHRRLGRLRRGAAAVARPAAGAHRRARLVQRRSLGRLQALRRVHALHRALQHLRPAGDLAAALPRRRRPARRRPARRAAGGRGDAAVALRPARGGRALGGAAPGAGDGTA